MVAANDKTRRKLHVGAGAPDISSEGSRGLFQHSTADAQCVPVKEGGKGDKMLLLVFTAQPHAGPPEVLLEAQVSHTLGRTGLGQVCASSMEQILGDHPWLLQAPSWPRPVLSSSPDGDPTGLGQQVPGTSGYIAGISSTLWTPQMCCPQRTGSLTGTSGQKTGDLWGSIPAGPPICPIRACHLFLAMLLLLMIPFHLHWFTWVWRLVIPLTTSALCSVPSQAAVFWRGWHSIPLLGARTQLLHRSVTRCPSLLGTAHDLEGPVTRSPLGSHLFLQQDLDYDCC